jgi:predicted acylesterase/phospholipase RssA
MTLGEFIYEVRSSKNIGAKSLSKRLGAETSYINKVEKGLIEPNLVKLEQILDFLNIPNEYKAFILLEKNNLLFKRTVYDSLKPGMLELIADLILNGNVTKTKKINRDKKGSITLIMKGGGIKGIAYIGALEELLNHYKFNWYVGTSAGAISAILLASGHSVQELKDILLKKNFDEFRDARLPKAIINLFFHSGLYPADNFSNWISKLLAEKLESPVDVLLKDLPTRTTVYACMKDRDALVFDSYGELANTPASFAARCSMSIPFVFIPQQHQGMSVVDGGMRNNYAVSKILKGNANVDFIGLYLGHPIYDQSSEKKGFFRDLFKIWTEANDVENLKLYKNKTIVIDPGPITTLDLVLTTEEKKFLIESGRIGALIYLKRINKIKISKEELQQKKDLLEIQRKKIFRFWKIKRTFRVAKSIILPN